MNGDPRTEPVTAKILFKGVMLTCINARRHYEVGLIRCPVHEPEISIEVNQNGTVSTRNIVWPNGHDLLFQVINPYSEGVSPFPSAGSDLGFGRIIDLEGPDLHKTGVVVNKESLRGRRLGVTAGRLYTHALSEVDFNLMTWTDANDEGTVVKPLGTIADQIGLNIVCPEGAENGIRLLDLNTGETVAGGEMPALPGRFYTIRVLNDCSQDANAEVPAEEQPLPSPAIGTDFRFYYDFVESRDGLKYDLDFEGAPGPDGEPMPSPGACENSFLSQTDTLGLGT